MKDDQITLRLPRNLARALARRARQRGIPKSRLVREAIEGYLAATSGEPNSVETWQRVAPLIGVVELDQAVMERDALTRQIRDHNWRD